LVYVTKRALLRGAPILVLPELRIAGSGLLLLDIRWCATGFACFASDPRPQKKPVMATKQPQRKKVKHYRQSW